MANWSCLPHDLLILNVQHLKKLEDFAAFGAVCKSWRAAAKKEHFKGLWLRQRTPYLMLPARNGNDEIRELYSLAEGEIVASVTVPNFSRKKCYESLGWLLAVEDDGSLSLLNPFSGIDIPLPHQSTFPERYRFDDEPYRFVRKMVLTARPNETSDFIVMIIVTRVSELAFWRPGDETWTNIPVPTGYLLDVMYQDGKFYTYETPRYVKAYDLAGSYPLVGQTITDVARLGPLDNVYILKTLGSVLLIERIMSHKMDMIRRRSDRIGIFQVYEVDMLSGTCRKISSLGNRALFVGHSATTAVDAYRFPGFIKANHIYFTDDEFDSIQACWQSVCGKDMGAYNMETGTVESFYHGEVELVCSNTSPTTWITPCF